MLTLDLSKVVPRTAFTYVSAFVPGLFFELSILLGNPCVVSQVLYEPGAFKLSHYETLAVGLFFAYVIGTTAMFFVCPLVQTLVGYVYRFRIFAWQRICRRLLFPLGNRLLKGKFWRRRWVFTSFQYVQYKAFPFDPIELMDSYRLWRELARKLLKERFEIELHELGNEWVGLYWHLGTPTGEELRGYVLVIAAHATGWAGLAALLFAPALRNIYFIGFCILMVVIGLQHDYYVARRRYDPLSVAAVRIRALLRECGKTRSSPTLNDQRLKHDNVPI